MLDVACCVFGGHGSHYIMCGNVPVMHGLGDKSIRPAYGRRRCVQRLLLPAGLGSSRSAEQRRCSSRASSVHRQLHARLPRCFAVLPENALLLRNEALQVVLHLQQQRGGWRPNSAVPGLPVRRLSSGTAGAAGDPQSGLRCAVRDVRSTYSRTTCLHAAAAAHLLRAGLLHLGHWDGLAHHNVQRHLAGGRTGCRGEACSSSLAGG